MKDTVAIIGMAGRFPDAPTLDRFWDNLVAGRYSVRHFGPEQLTSAGVSAGDQADPRYVPARGVIDEPELFDAEFFGMSAREAEITDPQQRIALECAWQALEDAGCDPGRYAGSIGVFAGSGVNTYLQHHLLTRPDILDSLGALPIVLGNEKDHLATRIAYRLGLRGPAVTVQTGCSTSLVAVHFARQSLLTGDSDIAIAGGVCVTVPQETGYVYDEHGIASPDGHCRAFAADARGTVAGNGIGLVVLKRTADALADGDPIRAIIPASAINNDGNAKVGYTAPSIDGQAAVIRRAYQAAGIDPSEIGYIEAHGTATEIGDAIEMAALIEAFRGQRPRSSPCRIGSLKPNIGHLDAAAGVAGLIKVVLALEHGVLPASIDCAEPNPQIPFAEGPFVVNAATGDWPGGGLARRAGVSSFGMGGTNVHLVVQEPPARQRPAAAVELPVLLPVSGRTESALDGVTRRLVESLTAGTDPSPAAVARTLVEGRAPLRLRRGLVWGGGPVVHVGPARQALARSTVCLLFPGQGSQYPGMGAALRQRFPTFRQAYQACADGFGLPLDDLPVAAIDDTSNAQPALFAVEYALAQLLREWNVKPRLMIGHSIGEYVAVTLAGGMSLPDALRLVAARGRLMASAQTGQMLAVAASEDVVRDHLSSTLDIAAVNAPNSVVLSGPAVAIATAEQALRAAGMRCRRLAVSHAFHSAAMDPILDKFAAEAATVTHQPLTCAVVSNVSGEVLPPGTVLSAEYWVRHLRGTVRFRDGVRHLAQARGPVLIETGPGHALTSMVSQCPEAAGAARLTTLPGRDEEGDGVSTFLAAVGNAWACGVDIHWPDYSAAAKISLPAYPFDRRRYWIDPPATATPAPPPPPSAVDGDSLRQAVGDIWVSLVGGSAPEPATSFFESGGESVIAVRMLARIRIRLKLEVGIDTFLQDPTFGGLVSAVALAESMRRP